MRPSGSGVPLRTRLDAVGKFFECVTDNILGASGASCPILPAADGGACQQNFTVVTTHGKWDDSFTGPGNTDEDGPGSFDGGAYADSYSNTLADIAMHYYERDLATNLSNAVPVTAGVDTATHQHMVTYALALGASGTLSANPRTPKTASRGRIPWLPPPATAPRLTTCATPPTTAAASS